MVWSVMTPVFTFSHATPPPRPRTPAEVTADLMAMFAALAVAAKAAS
jgi:hypothetical protein